MRSKWLIHNVDTRATGNSWLVWEDSLVLTSHKFVNHAIFIYTWASTIYGWYMIALSVNTMQSVALFVCIIVQLLLILWYFWHRKHTIIIGWLFKMATCSTISRSLFCIYMYFDINKQLKESIYLWSQKIFKIFLPWLNVIKQSVKVLSFSWY